MYLTTETTISHQASRASWQTKAPPRKLLEMTRSTLKTTILLQRIRGKAKPRTGSTAPPRKRHMKTTIQRPDNQTSPDFSDTSSLDLKTVAVECGEASTPILNRLFNCQRQRHHMQSAT